LRIEGEVIIKKNILLSVIIVNFVFIIIFSLFSSVFSQTISVDDYIKDKFPSIFNFYLSSLEELDQYEKEFIDLLQKLPEEEQEYYAKEVYKNGFSLELLKSIKEGKIIQVPTDTPSLPKPKEKLIESLPSIIKRIEPSTVIVFTYDDKGDFLQLGSGFFISQNGDIITNYHVLQGASSAEAKTSDGKIYSITHIVADDEQSDIICLSVDIPSKYVYPLSLSITIPEVGEKIIVYGSPLGLEKTVSDGIVSAIREVPDYGKLIQITAPISPGSSGSPVLNMNGEVIGVATFQFIEGQNLNFAIPAEKITKLDLTKELEISTTEEIFGQGSKEKKDSDYAWEAANKALYFIDRKEHEKALPYFKIAIKTDISSLKAWAYFGIGFCYTELGAYTKAIEAYTQTIRIDPDYSDTYHNMGVSYFKLDNYAKATEAFEQAIRINPYLAKAHFGLGLAFLMVGDKSLALDEYKILKDLDVNLANKLFDLIYE
jgi:S1-C subfamily serine protease